MERNLGRYMREILRKTSIPSCTSPYIRGGWVGIFLFFSTQLHAGGLAQKVQQTYQQTHEFQADFVQRTHVELLNRDLEEKGQMVFSKPGRFLIHYQGGQERKYISDGQILWIVHIPEKETEIYDNIRGIISKETIAFLGGLGEMMRDFNVTEKKETLSLTPREKGFTFSKVVLGIDPKTYLVKELTLFPKNGNQSHYLFSSILTNQEVAPTDFQFSDPSFKTTHPLAP